MTRQPEALASCWPSAVFAHAGHRIPYAIRTSGRATHPHLWISPATGLVLVRPQRGHGPRLDGFLHRHRRWILREWRRLIRRFGSPTPRWPYGPRTLHRGEPQDVRLSSGRPAAVIQGAGRLVLRTRTPTIEAGRRLLKRWRVAEAKQALTARVAARAQAMGLAWRRLSVGEARSRWGSCYPSGALHFNWRLIMAPPDVLDYVVVHELCHRAHPNHSAAFWVLVARQEPRFDAARAWLRRHGPTLE